MKTTRRSHERGYADHGWLTTRYTFSFADYYDPQYLGFRSLRVLNEDRVAAGQGFGMHGHRDMEILSYVLQGELEHKDSLGNRQVLHPGEFQRITAGRGIVHSEFNPSPERPTHFYQIWILPERKGLEPSYEQRQFDRAQRMNRCQLVASRNGDQGSLRIHQDAKIFLADLSAGGRLHYGMLDGRGLWLQVLSGAVDADGRTLEAGDGLAMSEGAHLMLSSNAGAEVMLFDLA